MPEVPMPRLSDSMTEGTVVRWLHPTGAAVEPGDDLVEIETDKATVTCEAEAAGTLHILAAEGTTLPIGAPIARLTTPADPPIPASGAPGAGPRPAASPLARRLARERGVDLAAVQGTGPGGRIVRADVDAAAPPPATGVRGEVTVVRPGAGERVVARRMAAAAGVPCFRVAMDVDMGGCARLRAELGKTAGDGVVPSYNDLVVKAVGLALREFPRVNAAYVDGAYELYGRVNVGVAVDAGDALLVPTVFDADRRTLTEIARTTTSLAERARAGTITPDELDGGTFTVSNLGMYGVAEFTALVQPPQAAVLAVGEIRRGMRVTLTCDHRIVYGARAARFLARVRELLERPEGVVS